MSKFSFVDGFLEIFRFFSMPTIPNLGFWFQRKWQVEWISSALAATLKCFTHKEMILEKVIFLTVFWNFFLLFSNKILQNLISRFNQNIRIFEANLKNWLRTVFFRKSYSLQKIQSFQTWPFLEFFWFFWKPICQFLGLVFNREIRFWESSLLQRPQLIFCRKN